MSFQSILIFITLSSGLLVMAQAQRCPDFDQEVPQQWSSMDLANCGAAVCTTNGYCYRLFRNVCCLKSYNERQLFAGQHEKHVATDMHHCAPETSYNYNLPYRAPTHVYASAHVSSYASSHQTPYVGAQRPYLDAYNPYRFYQPANYYPVQGYGPRDGYISHWNPKTDIKGCTTNSDGNSYESSTIASANPTPCLPSSATAATTDSVDNTNFPQSTTRSSSFNTEPVTSFTFRPSSVNTMAPVTSSTTQSSTVTTAELKTSSTTEFSTVTTAASAISSTRESSTVTTETPTAATTTLTLANTTFVPISSTTNSSTVTTTRPTRQASKSTRATTASPKPKFTTTTKTTRSSALTTRAPFKAFTRLSTTPATTTRFTFPSITKTTDCGCVTRAFGSSNRLTDSRFPFAIQRKPKLFAALTDNTANNTTADIDFTSEETTTSIPTESGATESLQTELTEFSMPTTSTESTMTRNDIDFHTLISLNFTMSNGHVLTLVLAAPTTNPETGSKLCDKPTSLDVVIMGGKAPLKFTGCLFDSTNRSNAFSSTTVPIANTTSTTPPISPPNRPYGYAYGYAIGSGYGPAAQTVYVPHGWHPYYRS